MNNTVEKPRLDGDYDERRPFKNYRQAFKSLRALQPPLGEREIAKYLDAIRGCPTAPYVAFRLLALRAVGELRTRLAPFIDELEDVLHHGSEPIELRHCQTVEEIRRPILQRLEGLKGKTDLKRFAAAWDHLPLLYAVIRVWDDAARFQVAVEAIAEELGRLSAGKRSRSAATSNYLEILARALATRVPEKAIIGKRLADLLKIAWTLFRQSTDTGRENLDLQAKVATTESELSSLRDELKGQVETRMITETELASVRERLCELESKLDEEREHFNTLKGHSEQDRAKVVADAIARIRADVLRRLENIRLFADRDQPNRVGILNLINEITESLADKGARR